MEAMKTLFVFFIFTKDIKICLVPVYRRDCDTATRSNSEL